MPMSTWNAMEAERAFAAAARARRLAALRCRLRRGGNCAGGLPAVDGPGAAAGGACGCVRTGLRDIELDDIVGTLEPHRAADFDPAFRPSHRTRRRWERLWLAHARGAELPPIRVVALCRGYAVRDGHHRVSVARALGAVAITAVVDAR